MEIPFLWLKIIEARHTAQLSSPQDLFLTRHFTKEECLQSRDKTGEQEQFSAALSHHWKPYREHVSEPWRIKLVGPHVVCSNILIFQRWRQNCIRPDPYPRSQSPLRTEQSYTPCLLSPPLGFYPTHTRTGGHSSVGIQLSAAASFLIESTESDSCSSMGSWLNSLWCVLKGP